MCGSFGAKGPVDITFSAFLPPFHFLAPDDDARAAAPPSASRQPDDMFIDPTAECMLWSCPINVWYWDRAIYSGKD